MCKIKLKINFQAVLVLDIYCLWYLRHPFLLQCLVYTVVPPTVCNTWPHRQWGWSCYNCLVLHHHLNMLGDFQGPSSGQYWPESWRDGLGLCCLQWRDNLCQEGRCFSTDTFPWHSHLMNMPCSVFLETCISLNGSVNISHYQKLFILYIEALKEITFLHIICRKV